MRTPTFSPASADRHGNATTCASCRNHSVARIAVEAAASGAILTAQRAIGARAFLADQPVGRICRDLAFYLRQPNPDRALDMAATIMGLREPVEARHNMEGP